MAEVFATEHMLDVKHENALFERAQDLGGFGVNTTFEEHRSAAERHLSTQLSTVDNAFVRRAYLIRAKSRVQAVCASAISTSIEAATEGPEEATKILSSIPSLVRSLSELHGVLVDDLVELVLGCATTAEEQLDAQAKRLVRAEGETSGKMIYRWVTIAQDRQQWRTLSNVYLEATYS